MYVDFGYVHKFAFEIQCAEQTAEKWLERRKLYAIAGIKDIWLFGANYYKEIKAQDIEEDEVVLRLKHLRFAMKKYKVLQLQMMLHPKS